MPTDSYAQRSRGGFGRGFGGYGRGIGYGGLGYRGFGYGLGGYGLGYGGLGYYGLGYGGWGYPYYGGYGYGLGSYYSPYYYSSPTYVTPYYSSTIVPTTSYQSLYPATTQSTADPTRAHIHVHVPPNAQVLFDNTPTREQGTDRDFVTPPLQPNAKGYTYEVTARWNQNGQEHRESRTIRVTPGGTTDVNFLSAPAPERAPQPQPVSPQVR